MRNGRLKNRIDAEIILSSTPVGRSVDCCLEMDSHSPYSKEKSVYTVKKEKQNIFMKQIIQGSFTRYNENIGIAVI